MRIQWIFVFLSIYIKRSSQQCNLLKAFQCYTNKPEVPQSEELTHDPNDDIIQPCIQQLDQQAEVRGCVDEATSDACLDLRSDAFKLIDKSGSFCNRVINECTGAVFEEAFFGSLGCTLNVLAAIINKVNITTACSNFSDCLVNEIDRCEVMSIYATERWQDWQVQCNEEGVETPPELQDAETTEEANVTACADFEDIALDVYMCYATFLEYFNQSEPRSTEFYCNRTWDMYDCISGKFGKCSGVRDAFELSIRPFTVFTNITCGTEDVAKCDLTAVSSCLGDVKLGLLQLEVLMEDADTIDSTNIVEHVKERALNATSLIRNIVNTCNNDATLASLDESEECLNESLSGCPAQTHHAMLMEVQYSRKLCHQLRNCSDIEDSLANCANRTLMAIKELFNEGNDSLAIKLPLFCMEFMNLISCLNATFIGCPGQTPEISALYVQLIKDLEPVCNSFGPIEDIAPDLTENLAMYLECDILMSAQSMEMHSQAFFLELVKHPTSHDWLCQQSLIFLENMRAQYRYCPSISDSMETFISDLVTEYLTDCTIPTVPPVDPETPEDPGPTQPGGGPGDGETGGGDGGGGGGGAATLFPLTFISCILLPTGLLLLQH